MHQPKPASERTGVLIALIGALAMAASDGARAEANPYYFGLSQAIGHDSNVFRVDSSVVPDKYAITSLQAGVDQPIGRQRLQANASVYATRYEDVTILNNTGYGLNAALNWSTIERISGTFDVALNRSLANYAASGDQVSLTKKNLETSSRANARVQLGLVSLLSLNATLGHSQLAYSAPEFALSEVRQNSAGLGLAYRPSDLLTLGSAARLTKGEYPNFVLPSGKNETFDRKDLDLTAIWVASGLSTINARVSFTRATYEAFTNRDLSGATGALSWAWLPTGKLSFNTTLSRDSGAESSFFDLANKQGSAVGDNSALTNTIALNAGYEATAKIRVNAGARYSRRNLVNNQVVGGVVVASTEGRDSVTSFTLGASYDPTRNWRLGCNAGHDRAEPTDTTVGVSTRYASTTASCTVQLTVK